MKTQDSAGASIFGDKSDVAKELFVIAVTVLAVAPRLPMDEPWTIGGNLSNSFRKLVLVICALHLFREFWMKSFSIYPFVQGLEGVMQSFLSMLTPYLLRIWMTDRINFQGSREPGKGLMPWFQLFAVLSLISMVGKSTMEGSIGDALWIFKKVADTLSYFPVAQTLKLWNSMHRGRYPGRGPVLSQVVLLSEQYSFFANFCDVLSKLLYILGIFERSTLKSSFWKGMYLDNLFAAYTRILCHSILLNTLDEVYEAPYSSEPPTHSDTSTRRHYGPTVETVDEDATRAIVSKV